LDAAADGFLMPALNAAGEFIQRPLSGEEAAAWSRELMTRGGATSSDVTNTGTHGAKATLMTWMAKFGSPKADRRILGGHVKAGDVSVQLTPETSLPLHSVYLRLC
jgi:hypothetical protein